jgi:hypothetical protein
MRRSRCWVKAAHDDAIEGERKVMISHSLLRAESNQADDVAGVQRDRDSERRGPGAGRRSRHAADRATRCATGAVDNRTRVLEGGEVFSAARIHSDR